MNNFFKIIPVAALICFLLVCSLSGDFAGGDGTEGDPYQISTHEHLNNMRNYLDEDLFFILENDIDLTAEFGDGGAYSGPLGWNPIGNLDNPFMGSFNGNGNTISGLFIKRDEQTHIGLFGFILGAKIHDLGLTSFEITGEHYTGALTGTAGEDSEIFSCFAEGIIKARNFTGGLIGYNYSTVVIDDCWTDIDIEANNNVGGIIGYNLNAAILTNSYSMGHVYGNNNVGGLIGNNQKGCTVEDSYSEANVTGNFYVGGIVGFNIASHINDCFNRGNVNGNYYVGGISGHNYKGSTIENSYNEGLVIGYGSWIGGITGYNRKSSFVVDSYNTAVITGSGDNESGRVVGGIVGYNLDSAMVNGCYNTADIHGNQYIGGIVGRNQESNVNNSYSEGNISGNNRIGGLVGRNDTYASVTNSYSTGMVSGYEHWVGGLIGVNTDNSVVDNSYSTGDVTGGGYSVGGFSGSNYGHSVITGSYSTGDVTGTSPYSYVGGFVGYNGYSSVIEKNYSTGNVNGIGYSVGGFVGANQFDSSIIDCYTIGNTEGHSAVGGLVGNNWGSYVYNSYSMGLVTGTGADVGGLIGYNANSTRNIYSKGHNGVDISVSEIEEIYTFNRNSSTVEFSYWDINTSGLSVSAGGEGRTTEEMTSPYAGNTYVGWNFNDIWQEDTDHSTNNGYPFLQLTASEVSTDEELTARPELILVSNYPNPFNPNTTIEFALPQDSEVVLEVFNVRGQKINTLFSGYLDSGVHTISWNGLDSSNENVSSGVYFTKISVGNNQVIHKMMLLK